MIESVETIINGKRMVLKGAPQYIEVALPEPPFPAAYWEADPLRQLRPITIRTQRHRLVRLVAEYELDGESR